jgi:hypothetical protein
MATVLSILAFALLFVLLGLVRRENEGAAGCDRHGGEDASPACDSCPMADDRPDSASHLRLVK